MNVQAIKFFVNLLESGIILLIENNLKCLFVLTLKYFKRNLCNESSNTIFFEILSSSKVKMKRIDIKILTKFSLSVN